MEFGPLAETRGGFKGRSVGPIELTGLKLNCHLNSYYKDNGNTDSYIQDNFDNCNLGSYIQYTGHPDSRH